MAILKENQPYYMYPFMHLLKDGNIFIFTAKASQIFNINTNSIVKKLPNLAGDYRTYPNSGGSVLLPLSSSNNWLSSVMVCGGGAYQVRQGKTFGLYFADPRTRTSLPPLNPAAVPSRRNPPTLPGRWSRCPRDAVWWRVYCCPMAPFCG